MPAPMRLRAENLPRGSSKQRCQAWIRRLEQTDVSLMPAQKLYMGEHWQVALSLPGVGDAAGLPVELWVASAGYGLIRDDDLIKPYAATFAAGAPDRVAGKDGASRPLGNRDWWAELSLWRGPTPGNPRSLSELAGQNPADHLLIALGSAYLHAVLDDIRYARTLLRNSALLLVVSAGTRPSGHLASNLIPVHTAHQYFLGGTRVSLNTRAARWLISTWRDHRFNPTAIASALAGIRRQPAMKANGKRMSDAEVSAFIQTQLEKQPSLRKSALLQKLRSQGQACEQARFAGIFEQVVRAR